MINNLQFVCIINLNNSNFGIFMNSKFYIFSFYFTLTLLCSFPSWSVTNKITRLLLNNKQIILLHDYHILDYASANQRDILLQFIENCKTTGLNVSLLLEETNDEAKKTNAKMSSSVIPVLYEANVIRSLMIQQPQQLKTESKVEIISLIDSLNDFGTAADWRVPFFMNSARFINEAYMLMDPSENISFSVLDQENGSSLFVEYLDTLEQMILKTLVSYNTIFRKYGEIKYQIKYNDRLIKLGRAEKLVVELLDNLNTVIRPKYKIISEKLKPMGFLSTTNLIRKNSAEVAKAIQNFLEICVADVGFYLQILKDLEQNDVVILAAGDKHCSNLVEELKAIGAIERPGVTGLTENEINNRLDMRKVINLNGGECSQDDIEKTNIAISKDEYFNLFKRAFNFKTKPENHRCSMCDESHKLLKCARCKNKFYCSKSCQTKDWPDHKKFCISH